MNRAMTVPFSGSKRDKKRDNVPDRAVICYKSVYGDTGILWTMAQARAQEASADPAGAQHVSYSADYIRKVKADERHFGEAQARLLAEFLGIPLAEQNAFVAWAHGGPTALSLAKSDQPLHDKEGRNASRAVEHEPDTGDHGPAMPSNPSPEAIGSPQAQVPRRFHWLWIGSAIVVTAVLISLILIAYQRGACRSERTDRAGWQMAQPRPKLFRPWGYPAPRRACLSRPCR